LFIIRGSHHLIWYGNRKEHVRGTFYLHLCK
jgi:hypothetical protein